MTEQLAQTNPANAKPHLIILVHGTGAGADDDRQPHWWQQVSEFTRSLVALIARPVWVAEPFRWDGDNHETTRRRAGSELLTRLRRLDECQEQYHLVGHSHGGSVIWHALVGSARQANP